MSQVRKIAVIGNSCAGKTRLCKKLAELTGFPLVHVDAIQYLPGLEFRNYKESLQLLQLEQNKNCWIIDGYGPLDHLQDRLQKADLIIIIDLPLLVHYLLAVKRVFFILFNQQRTELPQNSSERNLVHLKKLFKTIYQVHTKMRPEMLRILQKKELVTKTKILKSLHDVSSFISLYKV